jgi:hypothetical protein
LSLFKGIDKCCADEKENEDSCHGDNDEHEESEDDCCGVEQVSIAMDIDMESNQVFAFNFVSPELDIQPLYFFKLSFDEVQLINEPLRGPPLPVKSGRVLLLEKNTFLI